MFARTALTVIPTNGKTKSGINITSAVLRDSTGKREPSRHFAETLHHSEDSDASERITEKD